MKHLLLLAITCTCLLQGQETAPPAPTPQAKLPPETDISAMLLQRSLFYEAQVALRQLEAQAKTQQANLQAAVKAYQQLLSKARKETDCKDCELDREGKWVPLPKTPQQQ